MGEFFSRLFSTDFMPHIYCLRLPDLIWLHALSDGAIAFAYFLIPFGLLRLVQKRRDLAFHWLFFLFAAFILSCGATHVLEIVTLWKPIYRFDGLVKVVTALTSLPTAFILMALIPKIASLPSPKEWEKTNEALLMLNSVLESRVEERTQELEQKNSKLRELTAAWDLAHGMIRDQNGLIVFWCDGNADLYGWTKEEALGQISHDLLQTRFPKPLAAIEAELNDRGSWQGELIHTTKNGTELFIATHWILQRSESGMAACIIEVNNDITDRLRADETARHLAAIVESSNDAIIGTALPGNIISWNSSAERMFGYAAAEMIGRPIQALIPASLLEEEAAGVETKRCEAVLRNKHGKEVAVALTVSPILNSRGAVIGKSKILQDISERKSREEAVRLSEERQRLAVEAGQVGLWYLDAAAGGRAIWTHRCKELHGLRAEAETPDYPGFLQLLHQEDRETLRIAIERTMADKSEFAVEYRTRGLDFRTKWVQAGGRVQLDAEGRVRGIHGTVIDLTVRKETEERLRRANIELEQFAYAAAHDLQEPLRNVALSAALLRSNGETRSFLTQEELLGSVINNARRMEAMVKDLLGYSRALDGADAQRSRTDANQVLKQVMENLSATTAEKQAEITSDHLPELFMQEMHLLQVLQNLIGNALKYSGPERPRIHVSAEAGGDEIVISVTDNGPGIAPQFHARAFGMFKRLHGKEVQGTGIGLAVCKRIVEHYGGRIWIESAEGQGATFLFSVPSIGMRSRED